MPHPIDLDTMMPQIRAARASFPDRHRGVTIETPGPGQRSVWDFPRPPAVEAVPLRCTVDFAGRRVADSGAVLRVCETAGAPVYYFPAADVAEDALMPLDKLTLCEWKGTAAYFDLVVDGRRAPAAVFTLDQPLPDLGQGYERLVGRYAFYPGSVDACHVGPDPVTPQPGGYYAGWVTPDLTGPIKGGPGSAGW